MIIYDKVDKTKFITARWHTDKLRENYSTYILSCITTLTTKDSHCIALVVLGGVQLENLGKSLDGYKKP